MASTFDEGFLVGLLVGEGHFGGDGRQPQVTLRMHARHEAMFRWLERTFPGGRLYGPYEHGGRRYYQWMVRGAYLRDVIFPLLERHVSPTLDRYAFERLASMRATYARQLRRATDQEMPADDKTARLDGWSERAPTGPGSGPASTNVPAASSSATASSGEDAQDEVASIFATLRREATGH